MTHYSEEPLLVQRRNLCFYRIFCYTDMPGLESPFLVPKSVVSCRGGSFVQRGPGAAIGFRARQPREGAGCAAVGGPQQGRGSALGLAAGRGGAALLHRQHACRRLLPGDHTFPAHLYVLTSAVLCILSMHAGVSYLVITHSLPTSLS